MGGVGGVPEDIVADDVVVGILSIYPTRLSICLNDETVNLDVVAILNINRRVAAQIKGHIFTRVRGKGNITAFCS